MMMMMMEENNRIKSYGADYEFFGFFVYGCGGVVDGGKGCV